MVAIRVGPGASAPVSPIAKPIRNIEMRSNMPVSESTIEWVSLVNYPALKSGACNSGVTTDIAI
jgi:hypothetical protein